MDILHNHIGFTSKDVKRVVLQFNSEQEQQRYENAIVAIYDDKSDEMILSCTKEGSGSVDNWRGRYFTWFDFTPLHTPGSYYVKVLLGEGKESNGSTFVVNAYMFSSTVISDMVFYLKGQRSSGRWDEVDKSLPFYGKREGTVDARGGWFDASGDYSKYLSHLSYANYLNPQQIPLTVWSLLKVFQKLSAVEEHASSLLTERSLEEALWGADYLMRIQDEKGFFYMTVFDQWSKKSEKRMICAFKTQQGERLEEYQAGFRQGGGMAIAALSLASMMAQEGIVPSSYTPKQYLEAAIKGYDHLLEHNEEYLDNHKENIIDFYCALMASINLYRATKKSLYIEEGKKWVDKIVALYSDEQHSFLVESGSTRPFFHASDTGLLFISLLEYYLLDEKNNGSLYLFLKKACKDQINRTHEVINPFSLSRQRVKSVSGEPYNSFFIPHENESGYWWQGENARLASEASASLMIASVIEKREGESDFVKQLKAFGQSQIHWIFGCNPYNMCMMQGHGRNNPRYENHYPNAPGGICNGITAGFRDETDITYLPEEVEGRGDHRWRWSEQWIPHASWMLIAMCQEM